MGLSSTLRTNIILIILKHISLFSLIFYYEMENPRILDVCKNSTLGSQTGFFFLMTPLEKLRKIRENKRFIVYFFFSLSYICLIYYYFFNILKGNMTSI